MHFLARPLFNFRYLLPAVLSGFCLYHASLAQSIEASDYEHIRISGNSMLPTLENGEVAVFCQAYPYNALQVGDIVIVQSKNGNHVVHRIVRHNRGKTWITKGDNNRREDQEVLSPRNFAGLALVGESINRHHQYVTKLEGNNRSKIALANTDHT